MAPAHQRLPHEAEIANLEHELGALRHRYALMQRSGERLRRLWPIASAIIAGLVLMLMLMIKDFGAGLFAVLMIVAVGVLIWLLARGDDPEGAKRFRWIDLAAPAPHEFYYGPSEAERVETWIADRERRLAELKSYGHDPST